MSDTRVNLATALRCTAISLSDVAAGLAATGTDEEIERQAQLLGRWRD